MEAIDVSYIQMLATNFILSRSDAGNGLCVGDGFLGNLSGPGGLSKFKVFPWATQWSNHKMVDDQFRGYCVPDTYSAQQLGVPTLDLKSNVLSFQSTRLSLSAKDFTKDYADDSSANSFEAVVTVFFIDTAKNFLNYARTVRHILKPGGIWINVGPLLWNCYENGPPARREGDVDNDEDTRTRFEKAGQEKGGLDVDVGQSWDPKIELSNEEVLEVLQMLGFVVRKAEILEENAGYIQDPFSMLQSQYQLSHWLVQVPTKDS